MTASALRIEPSLVRFRPATHDEVRFITSSWVGSMSEPGTVWEKALLSKRQVHGAYRFAVPRWVDRHYASVTVLEFADVPDEIVGWAAVERTRLHCLYVKKAYRRCGLGRQLLERACPLLLTTSCQSAEWKRFAMALGISPRHDPFPFLQGAP